MKMNAKGIHWELTPRELAYQNLLQSFNDIDTWLIRRPVGMNPDQEEKKRYRRANQLALDLFRANAKRLGFRNNNGQWIGLTESGMDKINFFEGIFLIEINRD